MVQDEHCWSHTTSPKGRRDIKCFSKSPLVIIALQNYIDNHLYKEKCWIHHFEGCLSKYNYSHCDDCSLGSITTWCRKKDIQELGSYCSFKQGHGVKD